MAGISSKALKTGYDENKKGFNSNEIQNEEFNDGSGLELYDFNARTYDQQIGRFIQIDPEFENFDQEKLTPYQFAKNDPIRFNDPTGRCPLCAAPAIPYIVEGVVALVEAAIVVIGSNELGKGISKAVNNTVPIGGGSSGSNFGVPTGETYRKLYSEEAKPASFNRQGDTKSETRSQALKNAKEENGIPKSQQPDRTIKPNTPDGKEAKLDERNVRQYEYTNSKGEKVVIREDKPATYNDGGKGDQGPHFNAGQNPSKGGKLPQHHYFDFKSRTPTK